MNRYWPISALVLPLLLIAAGGCTKETAATKAAHHKERAIAYFDKGEYREAIVELKNVVQIAPDDHDAHYRMALSHLKLGTVPDLQQSFKELSATVELNAGNQDAQLKLGQLLLLAKEPAKARAHADIVLTSAPDSKEGVILRGASLLNEGKIQEGIAELKRAIVLDPQNVNLYIDLARAYVHIKDYGSAESVLQQALQANPQSIEARFALGDLHLINRKADLAEAEYKRALSDAPDRPEPRVKLAGFYASVNRLADAEATYVAWVQSKPQDDAPLLALGDFYRATDQLDKAAATYQNALAVNPKSTASRDRQIAVLIASHKLDEAERQTTAILQANSKDSSGRLFEAQLKLARGQIDNALPLLQALSQEEPRSPAPHHFLGVVYAKKGDLPQAVQELKTVIELAPNAIESHAVLASVYLTQGSADLALEQAQAVLRLNPRSVQAATIMGEAYLRKNEITKAGQVFESITKVAPNHEIAHHRLGLIARSNKNPVEALVHFEQALKAKPDFIEPLAQIATIKASQGKLAEARDRIKQHRELVPKNPLVYNLLGQLFTATKEYDQAEASFKQAIALNDAILESYTGLAGLYLQTKRLDEAIREYETALAKNPKLAPAHMMIGMIHESRQQYDQAQTRYQEAVRINPRFAPAANNLAWLMVERGGNVDVALGYAQTAREVTPTDPNVADTLGWIYYQKKVYLKAVSLLKEAADQLHENPVILYHYGMAQYRNENKPEARKALEKSLQLNANHPGASEAKATLEEL